MHDAPGHYASCNSSRMLEIACLLNQGESARNSFHLIPDVHPGSFLAPASALHEYRQSNPLSKKTLTSDHLQKDHSLELVKVETSEALAGDQQSAMTISNITSASGEVSGSSGERGTTITGGGGGGIVSQQLHQHQQGQQMLQRAAGAAGIPPLNSNGLTVAVKRKRNLPGTPDPDAEVIALSPKTLMATNRFVCEICSKGFQRDQNLQLHRRGHNLPWKLRQRTSKEVRKRVYICPEPSCVHHDPSRALGDLTGIKKHFCRKHGEKKWKCDKCSKRYAVQSDWKAHSKTCGTREYRCDCGTLFSRRDSFITHRAFCDALAEESARVSSGSGPHEGLGSALALQQAAAVAAAAAAGHGGGPLSMSSASAQQLAAAASSCHNLSGSAPASRPRLSHWLGSGPAGHHGHHHDVYLTTQDLGAGAAMDHSLNAGHARSTVAGMFASQQLASTDYDGPKPSALMQAGGFNALISDLHSNNMAASHNYGNLLNIPGGGNMADMMTNSLSGLPSHHSDFGSLANWQPVDRGGSNSGSSTVSSCLPAASSTSASAPLIGWLSGTSHSSLHNINMSSSSSSSSSSTGLMPSVSSLYNQSHSNSSSAQMSATALLQKAAQMGATASNASLIKGLGNIAGPETLLSSWQSSHSSGLNQPERAAGVHHYYQGGSDTVSNMMQSYAFMRDTVSNSDMAGKAGLNPPGMQDKAAVSDQLMQSSTPQYSSSNSSQLFLGGGRMANHGITALASPNTNHHDRFRQLNSTASTISFPKVEADQAAHHEKLTRDFLGVRGVNSQLLGSPSHTSASINPPHNHASSSTTSSSSICNISSNNIDLYISNAKESIRSLQGLGSLNSHPKAWDDL